MGWNHQLVLLDPLIGIYHILHNLKIHAYIHSHTVYCVHIICWGAFPLPVRHQEAFTFTTVGDPLLLVGEHLKMYDGFPPTYQPFASISYHWKSARPKIIVLPTTCFLQASIFAKCLVGKGQVFHRIHEQCLPILYSHESICSRVFTLLMVLHTCVLGHKGVVLYTWWYGHPTPPQPLGGRGGKWTYYMATTCLLFLM